MLKEPILSPTTLNSSVQEISKTMNNCGQLAETITESMREVYSYFNATLDDIARFFLSLFEYL
jgi:hypothetical protein